MTFYVKPPDGKIALKKLHQDAETRLRFLYQINRLSEEEVQIREVFTSHPTLALYSECLIEGSLRDRTSHFILRFASLKSKSFQIFLIDAETHLFQYRIAKGEDKAVKQSLKNLKRHSSFALKNQILSFHHKELLEQTQRVVDDILASGMVDCQDDQPCTHSVRVPWTMVASLVRDRLVVVKGGEVEISCHFFMQFLRTLFSTLLVHGINEMSSQKTDYEIAQNDQRMAKISQSLRDLFKSKYGGNQKIKIPHLITHRDIPSESKYFPLCMQQLHQTLSKTNRLRHHARLRYTLFLKDIGLPVEENIALWEHFYSKPYHGSGTSCNHSWHGSGGNRYRYSVRHVYGLEGGRINYSSHTCHALQAMKPQPSEMSGCPFSGWDLNETYLVLKATYGDQPFLKTLMKAVEEGKPSFACKLLMKYSLQSFELTPVESDVGRVSLCGSGFTSCCKENELDLAENTITLNKSVEGVSDSKDNEYLRSKCSGSCDKSKSADQEICKANSCIKPSDTMEKCSSLLKNVHSNRILYKEKNKNTGLHLKTKFTSSHIQSSGEISQSGFTKNSVMECGSSTCGSQLKSADDERHNCQTVSDIEDLSWLASCNYLSPSQYYLQAKCVVKQFKKS